MTENEEMIKEEGEKEQVKPEQGTEETEETEEEVKKSRANIEAKGGRGIL